MADHAKPTPEELDENIKKAQENIEAEEDKKEDIDSGYTEDDAEENDEEESQDDVQEEDKKEDIDYKKKFVDSTREAQVLAAKNKKINEAIAKASEIAEPTEDELKKEYSDWDDMTVTEQRFAKDNFINKRRFEVIHESTKEFKDIDAWNSKIDAFVDDPKTLTDNPKLEGKLEEFKAFAAKPTRRGIDLDDLVSAFLYSASIKPANKGKMIQSGGGGGSAAQNKSSDKISLTQARQIMKTDYQKYKSLLMAGKISNL